MKDQVSGLGLNSHSRFGKKLAIVFPDKPRIVVARESFYLYYIARFCFKWCGEHGTSEQARA